MVDHPIYVPRSAYRGSNPREQRRVIQHNLLATRLEQHINAQSEGSDEDVQLFIYRSLAATLQVSEDEVRKVMFLVGGGRHSLSVRKV